MTLAYSRGHNCRPLQSLFCISALLFPGRSDRYRAKRFSFNYAAFLRVESTLSLFRITSRYSQVFNNDALFDSINEQTINPFRSVQRTFDILFGNEEVTQINTNSAPCCNFELNFHIHELVVSRYRFCLIVASRFHFYSRVASTFYFYVLVTSMYKSRKRISSIGNTVR